MGGKGGTQSVSRGQERRYDRQLKDHESEAHRMADRLTGRLNASAA
ncbi:hypothetical protein A3Q37_04055 [Streptomyces sp. PTY087I2]|nr:hypothetical protein A3Q37_04055 [Streptomyces sp. PTY087I2]